MSDAAQIDPDREWAKAVAVLGVDILVDAGIVAPEQFDEAVEIVAEEIFVRLAIGDRPAEQQRPLAFVVDCAGVGTEADFWEAYVESVKPEGREGFGRNLDAFWDAVSGGGPGWPGECTIHFINLHTVAQFRDGSFLSHLKRIGATQKHVELKFDR